MYCLSRQFLVCNSLGLIAAPRYTPTLRRRFGSACSKCTAGHYCTSGLCRSTAQTSKQIPTLWPLMALMNCYLRDVRFNMLCAACPAGTYSSSSGRSSCSCKNSPNWEQQCCGYTLCSRALTTFTQLLFRLISQIVRLVRCRIRIARGALVCRTSVCVR